MHKDHPWSTEPMGPFFFQLHLYWRFNIFIPFEVDLKPFIDFCSGHNIKPHQLTMKIAARLSRKHLPQYVLGLNLRPYPVSHPVLYYRTRKSSDLLDNIGVDERDDAFIETNLSPAPGPVLRFVARRFPRLVIFALKRICPRAYAQSNAALVISRNFLRGVPGSTATSTAADGMGLSIPFGDRGTCVLTGPHAFGNANFYEPLLARFKQYMERPATIPEDILRKEYRALQD